MLKTYKDPALAVFSTALARGLGLNAPSQRVISKAENSAEYKFLLRQIDWALRESYETMIAVK